MAILDENRPKFLKHSCIISIIMFDDMFMMFFFAICQQMVFQFQTNFSLPIPGKHLSSRKTVFVRVFIQSPLSASAIE